MGVACEHLKPHRKAVEGHDQRNQNLLAVLPLVAGIAALGQKVPFGLVFEVGARHVIEVRLVLDGFHRIRHYGLFASPRRASNILRLRNLIAADQGSQPAPHAGAGAGETANAGRPEAAANVKTCPCCGGRMSVVETFAPGAKPRCFKASAAGIDSS